MLRVAAYQATGPVTSIHSQLEVAKKVLQVADEQNIDIVCFPEGFLTGYYSDRKTAEELSLSCNEALLSEILSEIAPFSAVAVFGFNEKSEERLFNSVAVIERGVVIGIQRKHFLYHDYFTSGTGFSPITVRGISIGVLVCLDSNYLEPARILALQGVRILLVPMCNQVPVGHPFAQHPGHYSHFIARAYENNCWLVAADWTIPNNGKTVCSGHSCIYNPDGKKITRSEEGEQLLVADIPTEHLTAPSKRRVTGSEVLNRRLSELL